MSPSRYSFGAALVVAACYAGQISRPLSGKPNPADLILVDSAGAAGAAGTSNSAPSTSDSGSGDHANGGGDLSGSAGSLGSGGSPAASAGGSGLRCDALVAVRRETGPLKSERMQPRIVGGHPAVMNWVAAITKDGTQAGQFCGGSLIKKDWVLTAAHCRVNVGDLVIVGHEDLRNVPAGGALKVKRVLTHTSFSSATLDNDIALLQLETAASAEPVALEARRPTSLRSALTVAGWGRTREDGPRSPVLLAVDVPEVAPTRCRDAYPGTITEHMLCAGVEGKDSCQGDSGGPIAVKTGNSWTQVGIVSFGRGCGQVNSYGVYTRVSDYAEFITACVR